MATTARDAPRWLGPLLVLVGQRWRPSARLHAWLGVAVVACLLAPLAWIALAGDTDECRVRVLGLVMPGGAWLCRAGFAVGAAMGVLILALFIRQAPRTPKEPR